MNDKRETAEAGGDRRRTPGRRAADRPDADMKVDIPGAAFSGRLGSALAAAGAAVGAALLPAPDVYAAMSAGAVGAFAAWASWGGVSALARQTEEFAAKGGLIPPAPARLGGGRESAILRGAFGRMHARIHALAGERRRKELADSYVESTLVLLETLPDPVFWIGKTSEGLRVTWANDAARRIGVREDAAPPEWLGDPSHEGRAEVSFGEGKKEVFLEFAKREVKDRRGGAVISALGRDVSDRRRREITCPLTGALNRAGFNREVERLGRNGTEFSLIYIDLDKFKPVNDTYGHPAGDALLVAVAGVLGGLGGSTFRLGGDEFAMILPRADRRATEKVASEIVRLCNEPFDLIPEGGEPVTVRIGASVGAACMPEHARTAHELLKAADEAMYACKRAGRNRYAFPE